MTETSAGKIKKEEHIFKSTSGVCDIHTVIWYPDKEKYENPYVWFRLHMECLTI